MKDKPLVIIFSIYMAIVAACTYLQLDFNKNARHKTQCLNVEADYER